ncbi:MAG: tetratricopeptide repeat protein [Acidobacteriota bacterium]
MHAKSGHWRSGALLAGLLIAALALTTGLGADRPAQPQVPAAGLHVAPPDPLPQEVLPSEYADESTCTLCHGEIAKSYQQVGMAQSFYAPSRDKSIEDFDAGPWRHQASGRTYEMVWQEEALVFRRWLEGPEGERLHLWEQTVDWVMGSGNHSRSYLVHNAGGELYQLPIAWYTQEGRWGMSPGYDRVDHEGVSRRVRRECMACHTALPRVAEGSDGFHQPHIFPMELPAGTGCQRCHGPAARHVDLALGGLLGLDEIRRSVVNPGKLAPRERDSVCNQCHLQPSVAIAKVQRFGQGTYDFRPGEDLEDHLVLVDVEESEFSRPERFEINHHPYRLEQSLCFEKSAGELSCLTCHDPHRKVAPENRLEHFRDACASCHQLSDCDLEGMTAEQRSAAGVDGAIDSQDCVSCHMPKRRPQDVVGVVMTDHFIRRQPGGPELVAPRQERDPPLTGIHLMRPERRDPMGQLYRALSAVRAGGGAAQAGAELFEQEMARLAPAASEPWLDLLRLRIKAGRLLPAREAAAEALKRDPESLEARSWLAVAQAGQGRRTSALRVLDSVLRKDPARIDPRFNRGRIRLAEGDWQGAREDFQEVVAQRPNQASGWLQLAAAQALGEQWTAAADGYRQALRVNPRLTAAYRGLATALEALDRSDEAARWRQHGRRWAAEPELLKPATANQD